jgi:hypothetical protein
MTTKTYKHASLTNFMRVCDPQVLFCCLIYYLYKVEGNHVTGLISLFLDTGTECSVAYIKTAVLDFSGQPEIS